MIDRIEAKLDRLIPKPFDQIASEWEQLRAKQFSYGQLIYGQLQNICRGLDDGGDDSSPSPSSPFESEAGPAMAPRSRLPQPEPEVRLPQRRTHGGNFGPAVRAKLLEAALRG